MKKLLFIFCFIIFGKLFSQESLEIPYGQYNQWISTSNTCNGCGSFYVDVVATKFPDSKGLYYYDVYLWSNSFYENGYIASTYVKDVKVWALLPNGYYKLIFKTDYALVPPKSEYFNGYYYLAYVYSISAQETIKITWQTAKTW